MVHFLPVGLDKLHLIGPTNKCLFFGKKSLSVPPLLFPLCLPPLSSAVLPAVPDKSLPRPPLFIPLYLLHPGPTCDCSPSSHLLKFPCQPFFFLPPHSSVVIPFSPPPTLICFPPLILRSHYCNSNGQFGCCEQTNVDVLLLHFCRSHQSLRMWALIGPLEQVHKGNGEKEGGSRKGFISIYHSFFPFKIFFRN